MKKAIEARIRHRLRKRWPLWRPKKAPKAAGPAAPRKKKRERAPLLRDASPRECGFEPVCPRCGKIPLDWWDIPGDASEYRRECSFCFVEFHVTIHERGAFSTRVLDEIEKEEG